MFKVHFIFLWVISSCFLPTFLSFWSLFPQFLRILYILEILVLCHMLQIFSPSLFVVFWLCFVFCYAVWNFLISYIVKFLFFFFDWNWVLSHVQSPFFPSPYSYRETRLLPLRLTWIHLLYLALWLSCSLFLYMV